MLDTEPPGAKPPEPSAARPTTRPLALSSGLLAVAAIGAFFGESWWLFDIAASFRFQMLITALGLVLGALALRSRAAIVLAAVALVANAAPIVPLYLGSAPAAIDADLRVASYNLLASAGDGRQEVADWIMDVDADVIFLHEATRRWVRFFERSDVPYELHGPWPVPGSPFGTMALVRAGTTVERVDVIHRPSPLVTLEVDGRPVSLLGVHALSPYSDARSTVRDDDLLAIADWANASTTPVVVAGDFNATPFSWAFRSMLDNSTLVNSQDGFGLQPTWPTSNIFLRIPIDHLVHSADLVTIDRQVMPSFGSDHYPIVVDLARAD